MSTVMTIVEKKRDDLAKGVLENKDLIAVLPVEKQKEFQENFLEFATQDYLISKIPAREIIRFAVKVTKLGLNINPAFKEVYIVPFNTKTKGADDKDTWIMLPQAIIPLNGIQEMCYTKKFFLKLYEVYKINKEIVSEKDMTRMQQTQLKTIDPNWVDENFVGFDVVLTDLTDELPEQVKFVEASYVKAVTKTMQDDKFKIQSWRHKAVRRAWGDFYIPRARAVDIFDKVEHLNDQVLDAEIATPTLPQQVKAVKAYEQLQAEVKPLGIELKYLGDGCTQAIGNKVSSSLKTLQNLGFVCVEGQYKIKTTVPLVVTSVPTSTNVEVNESTAPVASQQTSLFGETPVIETIDQLELYLEELGLKMSPVTTNARGKKMVEIIEGNTKGLEEKLAAIGFKNAKGHLVCYVDDLSEGF